MVLPVPGDCRGKDSGEANIRLGMRKTLRRAGTRGCYDLGVPTGKGRGLDKDYKNGHLALVAKAFRGLSSWGKKLF